MAILCIVEQVKRVSFNNQLQQQQEEQRQWPVVRHAFNTGNATMCHVCFVAYSALFLFPLARFIVVSALDSASTLASAKQPNCLATTHSCACMPFFRIGFYYFVFTFHSYISVAVVFSVCGCWSSKHNNFNLHKKNQLIFITYTMSSYE